MAGDDEIIGAVDVTVVQQAWGTNGLTVDTLDTSGRTQVLLRLQNLTGSTKVMWACGLRGRRVRRLKGNLGWKHDWFRDRDRIREDGLEILEVGNDCIVSQDQTGKIANFLWKDNAVARHLYRLTLSGDRIYLEPGEWYTLTVGQVGQPEYHSTIVRCLRVQISRDANGIGQTAAEFREVMQGFTYDSTAIARYLVDGDLSQFRGREVIVGSSTSLLRCTSYCDGTADDTEMQAAIDYVAAAGGGVVRLTDGEFNTVATVTVASNVVVIGSGHTVVIGEGPGDIFTFEAGGSGIVLDTLTIHNGETTNYQKLAVNFNGASRSILQKCTLEFPVSSGVVCDGDFNKLIDNIAIGGRPAVGFSEGTPAMFYDGAAEYIQVAELDATHFVVCYATASPAFAPTAIIGTKVDEAITWGDPVAISGSGAPVVAALDSTHFVVGFMDSGWYYTRVGVVSNGNEIAFGASHLTAGAITWASIVRLDATHFALGHSATGVDSVWTLIGVVAGNAVTSHGTSYAALSGAGVRGGYVKLAAISAAKFAVAYIKFADYKVEARVASVSGGTVVAFGTAKPYASAVDDAARLQIAVLDETHFVVSYLIDSTTKAVAVLSTVGVSDVITIGDEAEFHSGSSTLMSLDKIDSGLFAVTYFDTTTGTRRLRRGEVASAITFRDEPYTYETAAFPVTALLGGVAFVSAYQKSGQAFAELLTIISFSDAIRVLGSGNIVQSNHVLGMAGYQLESGLFVEGDDNKVSGNLIDGLVGTDRMIDLGISIAGNRNDVSANKVQHCELGGLLNNGDLTLLAGDNTLYDNGPVRDTVETI